MNPDKPNTETGNTDPVVPTAPTEPSTPTLSAPPSESKTTSQDKIIGIILGLIGVLGIAGAILSILSFYSDTARAAAPPFVYLIVPLLFVYSGYYYLSGKNAARIQRKKGGGSFISKHYQKFGVVEALLTVLIIACVAYPIAYVAHKNSHNSPTLTTQYHKTTQWPVVSSDKTVTLYDLNTLATTPDQISLAKTLSTACDTVIGNGPANKVIADTTSKDIFSSNNPDYIQSGNFVSIHAACADKNTPAQQAFDNYARSLNRYILQQKDNTWQVLNVGSTEPDCTVVDHKGMPASVLNVCFDRSLNKERAPSQ